MKKGWNLSQFGDYLVFCYDDRHAYVYGTKNPGNNGMYNIDDLKQNYNPISFEEAFKLWEQQHHKQVSEKGYYLSDNKQYLIYYHTYDRVTVWDLKDKSCRGIHPFHALWKSYLPIEKKDAIDLLS